MSTISAEPQEIARLFCLGDDTQRLVAADYAEEVLYQEEVAVALRRNEYELRERWYYQVPRSDGNGHGIGPGLSHDNGSDFGSGHGHGDGYGDGSGSGHALGDGRDGS